MSETDLLPQTISAVYEGGVFRPLADLKLGERQQVRLHILPPAVRVPAEVARRKVSRFVLDQISYLMHGGEPTLVETPSPRWRVPVILTFPARGAVGAVGILEVDANTGEIYASPNLVEELTRNARSLAERASPETDTTG
ncbi:MAG TPA: DUF104 domain-containing protein [Anaerolineae bacterium]|nr:DUF104 domain-containing protein [Anaerolineae bacterium]